MLEWMEQYSLDIDGVDDYTPVTADMNELIKTMYKEAEMAIEEIAEDLGLHYTEVEDVLKGEMEDD